MEEEQGVVRDIDIILLAITYLAVLPLEKGIEIGIEISFFTCE